ncbi:MAG: glycosyltransferase family 4 protein [Candidatus Binatia bacterium]|jgi:glycosyltransferase involved in cell wall biosynthesis
MGVLFIMPNWAAPSELWMQRMIEALEPHVVAIATPTPAEASWRNRVPAVTLRAGRPHRQVMRCVCRALGMPVRLKPARTAAEILSEAVASQAVSAVLAHYLEFALQFEDVWRETSKRLFVHCHGYDVTWDLRKDEKPDEKYFADDYLPRVLRLSRRAILIANSQFTAGRLHAAGIPPDRVRVKYLGVPVPEQSPRGSSKTKAIDILYIGRLVDFKGPDLVIRAFEIACERGLDAHLTMAGDGEMRVTCELLKRRSAFGDRIRLLSWVDARQGEELRAQADIFTAHNCRGPLSRQEEAFGVSIVEAMASGLPVITGRSGSVCETVTHGQTGVLVEPGDVEAHAEAFLQLARDPELRFQMGQAGWQRSKLFSLEEEKVALWDILGLPTA